MELRRDERFSGKWLPENPVKELVGSMAADGFVVLGNGGQRRVKERPLYNVVKADDGNILRHAKRMITDAPQNALSALLGLLALMLSGERLCFDRMTLLLSLLFAFALFLAQVSSVLAIRLGTISLNSMAGTAGMLVPVLTGALFF